MTSGNGCGKCAAGEYLCPSDQKTCVHDAAAYVHCPSMNGTHFDWTLSMAARLDYLVNATTLAEQVSQLRDDAPIGSAAWRWLDGRLGPPLTPRARTSRCERPAAFFFAA